MKRDGFNATMPTPLVAPRSWRQSIKLLQAGTVNGVFLRLEDGLVARGDSDAHAATWGGSRAISVPAKAWSYTRARLSRVRARLGLADTGTGGDDSGAFLDRHTCRALLPAERNAHRAACAPLAAAAARLRLRVMRETVSEWRTFVRSCRADERKLGEAFLKMVEALRHYRRKKLLRAWKGLAEHRRRQRAVRRASAMLHIVYSRWRARCALAKARAWIGDEVAREAELMRRAETLHLRARWRPWARRGARRVAMRKATVAAMRALRGQWLSAAWRKLRAVMIGVRAANLLFGVTRRAMFYRWYDNAAEQKRLRENARNAARFWRLLGQGKAFRAWKTRARAQARARAAIAHAFAAQEEGKLAWAMSRLLAASQEADFQESLKVRNCLCLDRYCAHNVDATPRGSAARRAGTVGPARAAAAAARGATLAGRLAQSQPVTRREKRRRRPRVVPRWGHRRHRCTVEEHLLRRVDGLKALLSASVEKFDAKAGGARSDSGSARGSSAQGSARSRSGSAGGRGPPKVFGGTAPPPAPSPLPDLRCPADGCRRTFASRAALEAHARRGGCGDAATTAGGTGTGTGTGLSSSRVGTGASAAAAGTSSSFVCRREGCGASFEEGARRAWGAHLRDHRWARVPAGTFEPRSGTWWSKYR